MNTKYFMLLAIISLGSIASSAQSTTDTIKVWGNCEMCKSKIEKAALEAGATSANWSDETLQLVVNYDAAKSSGMSIEKKVASVGYDTENVKASDASYKKLDKCCQYQRPKGQSASSKKKCGKSCGSGKSGG